METSHERLKNSICCALFAALTAVGAFIRIPFGVISFTLQTFFVVLSGVLLGKKYGTMAQALYVILGLIGIPIFTKGGGPQYVLEPSFGYLLGFILGAFVIGWIVQRGAFTFWRLMGAACAGLAIIYCVGSVYMFFILNYYLSMPITIWMAFWTGAIIFSPFDIALSAAAIWAAMRLKPALGRV